MSIRLEVLSPGALQNSMTVEKMVAGQRSARNPLIVEGPARLRLRGREGYGGAQ